MNLKEFKIGKIVGFIGKEHFLVLGFLIALVLFLFRSLFNSYFEADEWVHFTYYLPLTRRLEGFLTTLIDTFFKGGFLTGEGQHINPIATAIFFLNTKFFGINFPPYAFMTLILHALNSFLVFYLMRELLHFGHPEVISGSHSFGKRMLKQVQHDIIPLISGIFFALAPTPMHAVTGAAAFYSSNVLSVTFFLLCMILFKIAFIKGQKKFIYASIVFLFLALFSKETAVFLFILLPFMVLIEKRVFPLKFLVKLFTLCLVIYVLFRFLVPNIYSPLAILQQTSAVDTGTIVSRDLSIHKNLPGEILFRTVTFPVKMTGTLFLPRQTVFSIVNFITPIVQPVPPGGDSADESQSRLKFIYGTGNAFTIYLASIFILIFCLRQIFRFIQQKQIKDAQALSTGLVIIILSVLPLVAIIFSFPRWGYDFYFDSRHYYNSNVGAAIIFPFLLFAFAKLVSKHLRIQKVSFVVFALFIIWLINNMYVFALNIKYSTQNFQPDRRKVVEQLKSYLPALPQKAVFYIETDGLSAYGPILPFQTSVPQALTVVYYDTSPLPDSFYDKPLFNGKGQGYMFSDGRGFGYYSSKKNLVKDLLAGQFTTSDIYAFFYEAGKVRVNDITLEVRREMEDYLSSSKETSDWKTFKNTGNTFSLLYPPNARITEEQESIHMVSPQFSSTIIYSTVLAGFDLNEYLRIREYGVPSEVIQEKVNFDRFHYNDTVVIIGQPKREYFVKLNDKLIKLETYNIDNEPPLIIEKIVGSIELIEQK